MANHLCKELERLFDLARNNGCRIVVKNDKYQIFPPITIQAKPYLVHYGERAFHPVRRFLKNTCKIPV